MKFYLHFKYGGFRISDSEVFVLFFTKDQAALFYGMRDLFLVLIGWLFERVWKLLLVRNVCTLLW